MSEPYSQFETELQVRPNDIDLFQHVHSSRYQDYVLAARYEQMERCYKMSMEAFIEAGLGWYVKTAHIEYKRALKMGDKFLVRTRIDAFFKRGVKVVFEMVRCDTGKEICNGYFDYSLIRLETGRAEIIPDWINEKYAI